jgi:hypothetical protein
VLTRDTKPPFVPTPDIEVDLRTFLPLFLPVIFERTQKGPNKANSVRGLDLRSVARGTTGAPFSSALVSARTDRPRAERDSHAGSAANRSETRALPAHTMAGIGALSAGLRRLPKILNWCSTMSPAERRRNRIPIPPTSRPRWMFRNARPPCHALPAAGVPHRAMRSRVHISALPRQIVIEGHLQPRT